MNTGKIWFVTGASKGLGLALVQSLLSQGYRVAATSRDRQQLHEAAGAYDEKQFLPLQVDLGNDDAVNEAVRSTQRHFGGLDVVVNNAGYGIGGAIEELQLQAIRDSFEVNVFAAIRVMQAALPILRAQKSGHIINISSIGGFAPATGFAAYAATKFALTGMTEALAEEIREFGIHATAVAPGAFRTQFLSDESLFLAEQQLPEYTAVRASHQRFAQMNGQQLGDPVLAAAALIRLAELPSPPVRLFLGSDAYSRAKTKIDLLSTELEANRELTVSTDHQTAS